MTMSMKTTTTISAYIPLNDYSDLINISLKTNRSMRELLNEALTNWFDQQKAEQLTINTIG